MATQGIVAGKRALVTGSASNIGRAIAAELAREGAEVFCVDIDEGRNRAVVEDIARAGGHVRGIIADLSGLDGWRSALPDPGTVVDLFVHSASPPRKEVDTVAAVSETTWDGMLNTNVRSGFLLARELGGRLQAAGRSGAMLFVTSLHAATPRNLPHYAAAKAAQTMVVKELARAWGRAGIRVNAIAPGAIPGGGFNASAFDFSGKIPMGRLGEAQDIANMALALLCDRFSGYVTGTTVAVDGGLALYNWIPASEA